MTKKPFIASQILPCKVSYTNLQDLFFTFASMLGLISIFLINPVTSIPLWGHSFSKYARKEEGVKQTCTNAYKGGGG